MLCVYLQNVLQLKLFCYLNIKKNMDSEFICKMFTANAAIV